MKRFILLLFITLTCVFSYAQNDNLEESLPSRDMEIVRPCSSLYIEGRKYNNVIVSLKSTSPDYLFNNFYKVKVCVRGVLGKKIYKKTFKNANLYIFSNGQVQVGKPKFTQILIIRDGDSWWGQIKEKEGIWL